VSAPKDEHRPVYCVWETTLACNLACRHCGSSAGLPRPHELSTQEALDLLAALRELGTEEVTFSGGEFIVRPDWRLLLARAKELGLASLIVSNGLSITPEVATEFARQDVGAVSLSIDGSPRVHDWLRPLHKRVETPYSGPSLTDDVSSHAQLGFAIDNLRRAGVLVGAITQVSKTNLGELALIEEFLAAREIEGWQLQMTNPMGRSARSSAAQRVESLEPADLPTLYAFVRRIQTEGRIRCLAADCLGYYAHDEPLLRSVERPNDAFWRGCQAGMRVLGITSDGGVKGCLSMPDTYLEGNLRERSLAELWNREGAFAYNRHFRVESLTGACAECAFGKLCRAGCHSFAATAQDGDISRYDHCIRLCDPGGAARR
jgi:radical SAM protein with 4Fe4S-binding SPASM domain